MARRCPSSQVKLAVGRCMVAEMKTEGCWIELGLVTGTDDVIQRHPRLLRSLRFGDDDYPGHVLALVGQLLGEWGGGSRWATGSRDDRPVHDRFARLDAVTAYLNLPTWLATSEPELHAQLFTDGLDDATMPDGTVLSAAAAAASRLQVGEMRRQIDRIRRDHTDDPEAAIRQAKELVETTCKTILGLVGDGPETTEDVPKLVARTLMHLGLDPKSVEQSAGDVSQARALKRLLGGVSSVLNGSAELRNARGTGHGKSGTPLVDSSVARRTVGLVLPAVAFLIETHAERTRPGPAVSLPAARPPLVGLKVGAWVRHDTFGDGKVLQLVGEGEKAIATVDVGSDGLKKLLTRFAPMVVL